MKRIEVVIFRSMLDNFRRCARRLGVFGFDLCEGDLRLRDRSLSASSESALEPVLKLKADFAVLDEQIKPAVHAILESVHPQSIAIFKFDEPARLRTGGVAAANRF
jgi:hypothetical protein